MQGDDAERLDDGPPDGPGSWAGRLCSAIGRRLPSLRGGSREPPSFTEAEFRRVEDEQEPLYEHGNKMDNGRVGPFGSL